MLFRDLEVSLDKKENFRIDLQKSLTASELEVKQKDRKIEELKQELGVMKRRVEFKSNLEKSFTSLQQKYQAKTDQLEKLKKMGSLRQRIEWNN